LKSGASLSQRELARLLKVSPTAIGNSLNLLIKEDFLKIKKTGKIKMNLIELNRDNSKVIDIKRVENLRTVYESGLADFLRKELPGSDIILFGSYANGNDVWFGEDDEKNSDLDIAVIGRKEKDINLENFEKILKKKIIINFYENWNIHKHLKESILNGITLVGGIEI